MHNLSVADIGLQIFGITIAVLRQNLLRSRPSSSYLTSFKIVTNKFLCCDDYFNLKVNLLIHITLFVKENFISHFF